MTTLISAVEQLRGTRVLVVGDVMLDRYWFGGVDRISPEAPVPVIGITDTEERPGGAANVATNVAALGAKCTLLSVIGDDEAGTHLTDLLSHSDIAASLHRDFASATTVKLRIISRNQQLLRADFEQTPGYEVLSRCMDDIRVKLRDTDVLIISDYGKGGLVHIADMIHRAREVDIPVMVDPKGKDFSRYRGATFITPNRREFEDAFGPCVDEAALFARAKSTIAELGVEKLLITQSDKGMTLFRQDGSSVHKSARAREVYDVSGAGDTVIAVMATAFGSGLPDESAMELANVAAGIVVGRLGTAAATKEEISGVLLADTVD
ncbi:MAG: D-glycero-beta-D-manno-heptose-7-phosphate kinase [Gammaproteobacteria bacterium]|nr:D-glycero-beta-D-manno-heptose-7-phosphate kinase [Gammaproteobacteria bacterium]